MLILMEIQLTSGLMDFQIQIGNLLLRLSPLLPLPLVHIQQFLATNSVNRLVGFEALLTTVVLGQAIRPKLKNYFQVRYCSGNHKSIYMYGLFCEQPVHIFDRSQKEAIVASCFT